MKQRRVRNSAPTLLRLKLLAIAAFAAGGCASGSGSSADPAPLPDESRTSLRFSNYAPIDIFNEPGVGMRTLSVGSKAAWGVLGGVYGQLEIPVTSSDPGTMQLGNPGYSARRVGGDRMNNFVDCGTTLSGALANLYDVTLSIVTKLTARGEERTEVLTVVDAYAQPRSVAGNPIHCESRGVLELQVAQLVAEALEVGS